MRHAQCGFILPTTMVVIICMFLLAAAMMSRGTGGYGQAMLASDDEIKMNGLSRKGMVEAQYRINHDVGFNYSTNPGPGPAVWIDVDPDPWVEYSSANTAADIKISIGALGVPVLGTRQVTVCVTTGTDTPCV